MCFIIFVKVCVNLYTCTSKVSDEKEEREFLGCFASTKRKISSTKAVSLQSYRMLKLYLISQLTVTYSKSTIETLEKRVKYVQS